MQSLLDFINARLDDWQRFAAAVREDERRWEYTGESVTTEWARGGSNYVACGPWDGDVREEYARHIVAHDPAKVLGRVDLLRQFMNIHSTEGGACAVCWFEVLDEDREGNRFVAMSGRETWPCPTVRILGALWSDHPDYDRSWASA